MRTAHRMGIGTVAVFSDADRDLPFVRLADQAVGLGGAAASESYLRVGKLLAAARQAGADAVHPGFGFLAENADFAEACEAAGVVFIGPTPDAIRAMGAEPVQWSDRDAMQRLRGSFDLMISTVPRPRLLMSKLS